MITNIDGININYEKKGEGEFVLFLHGWGSNIKLWQGLMDTVAPKYTALALDMPGFGESDEPKEAWNVDDYVDFVLKFVDVAIQSYKKPESLIYTLFSLKKYCSDLVETVYINDDCSGGEVVSKYLDANLQEMLKPLKIKVRINEKPSKYSSTIMTKTLFKKKPFIQKFQLILVWRDLRIFIILEMI